MLSKRQSPSRSRNYRKSQQIFGKDLYKTYLGNTADETILTGVDVICDFFTNVATHACEYNNGFAPQEDMDD